MKCIYLSEEGLEVESCRTVKGTVYSQTDEDKLQFCHSTFVNCTRYNAFQQHLGKDSIIQSRDIAFPMARSIINQSHAYTDSSKQIIIQNVNFLEGSMKRNDSKGTKNYWDLVKGGAGILVPVLQHVVLEYLKNR